MGRIGLGELLIIVAVAVVLVVIVRSRL